ncbi:hypothetical protein P22_1515 [Propionispora sp. 2/2-37]|uniref:DNA polymerase III subunit delta' n=1 Tax=Propionispora sp. 2/2-37 TaxID=1677858 RepID=UPI0006BB85A7|nr:DNA polymerase III subunit delta' [Propionispora sp. 2/2-37]CUH95444.1 hypothetical protein P22_1515 [Propionispora sp. 2/2-37]
MNWDIVIGHTDTIQNLKAMLGAGRMPHALLFAGPEGIGKTLVANILSAALLCSDSIRPCGSCLSCRQMIQGVHPDFTLVQPDGASIRIEQIRALQHQVSLVPYLAGRRVIIIENSEKMTAQAANSLLKILEEPPEHAVFILIAAGKQMLLDTVLSRCLVVPFYPVPWQQLAVALVDRGYPQEQAEVAARLGNGRMGTALHLLEPDGMRLRDKAFEFLTALHSSENLLWTAPAEWEKFNRPEIIAILRHCSLLLRDMLVYSLVLDTAVVFNLDLSRQLAEQAAYWRQTSLLSAFKEITIAEKAVYANGNIRLIIEALLIKLRELAKGGMHVAGSSWSTI